MFADFHAAVILATVIVPLIVVAASPAWRPRPVRELIVAVLPILWVGVICLCLLSATGVPIAEWLFPMIGLTIAALLVKSNRAFQTIRWTLFALSIGLCLNGMQLRLDDYVSSSTQRRYRAAERDRLAAVREKLQEKFPGNRELPPGSLATILPEQDLTTWNQRTLSRVWHTAFTGLYRVAEVPGEAWYPGGPVATGAAKVEWRPKPDT